MLASVSFKKVQMLLGAQVRFPRASPNGLEVAPVRGLQHGGHVGLCAGQNGGAVTNGIACIGDSGRGLNPIFLAGAWALDRHRRGGNAARASLGLIFPMATRRPGCWGGVLLTSRGRNCADDCIPTNAVAPASHDAACRGTEGQFSYKFLGILDFIFSRLLCSTRVIPRPGI